MTEKPAHPDLAWRLRHLLAEVKEARVLDGRWGWLGAPIALLTWFRTRRERREAAAAMEAVQGLLEAFLTLLEDFRAGKLAGQNAPTAQDTPTLAGSRREADRRANGDNPQDPGPGFRRGDDVPLTPRIFIHHPGETDGRNRHPGESTDENRHPGKSDGPNRHPGESNDENRHPGESDGPNRRPGESNDKNRHPGEGRDPFFRDPFRHNPAEVVRAPSPLLLAARARPLPKHRIRKIPSTTQGFRTS